MGLDILSSERFISGPWMIYLDLSMFAETYQIGESWSFGWSMNTVMSALCTYTAYSYQVSDFSDTLCTIYCFLSSDRKYVGSTAQYSYRFVGLERYWYWVIGYWAIFTVSDSIVIGGYFLLF